MKLTFEVTNGCQKTVEQKVKITVFGAIMQVANRPKRLLARFEIVAQIQIIQIRLQTPCINFHLLPRFSVTGFLSKKLNFCL